MVTHGTSVLAGHMVGRNVCLLALLPILVTLGLKPWCGEVGSYLKWGTSSLLTHVGDNLSGG